MDYEESDTLLWTNLDDEPDLKSDLDIDEEPKDWTHIDKESDAHVLNLDKEHDSNKSDANCTTSGGSRCCDTATTSTSNWINTNWPLRNNSRRKHTARHFGNSLFILLIFNNEPENLGMIIRENKHRHCIVRRLKTDALRVDPTSGKACSRSCQIAAQSNLERDW